MFKKTMGSTGRLTQREVLNHKEVTKVKTKFDLRWMERREEAKAHIKGAITTGDTDQAIAESLRAISYILLNMDEELEALVKKTSE